MYRKRREESGEEKRTRLDVGSHLNTEGGRLDQGPTTLGLLNTPG